MPDAHRPARRNRSRAVSILLWGVLLPVCALVGLGWLVGKHVYPLDLMAAAQSQLVVLMLGVLALGMLARRWRFTVCVASMCLLAVYPLVQERTLVRAGIGPATRPADVIRMVSININPRNERLEQDLELIMGLGADVVVLIEVPPTLSRAINRRGLLEGSSYPNWAHRAWVDEETSPGYILSRWPLEILGNEGAEMDRQHELHTRIDSPGGPFIVGLIHPLSPRTLDRWRTGNTVIAQQARAAAHRADASGLPVILGADLNAAPAQHRARAMRGAGLRQSKPLLRMGGSYPSGLGLPDALMAQIDDIWWVGDLRVLAWGMIEVEGSDHRAVVVDFALGSD